MYPEPLHPLTEIIKLQVQLHFRGANLNLSGAKVLSSGRSLAAALPQRNIASLEKSMGVGEADQMTPLKR